MQGIKSVSLLCDNLVEIELTPDDVISLDIANIGTTVTMLGEQFRMINTCESIAIAIDSAANHLLGSPFGEYGSLFNLIHQDHCVVSASIVWDDEDAEDLDLFIPWEGDLTNDLMTTKITEDGDLLIVISRKATVDSVFGTKECQCCRK